jgi:hypothetical protein
LLPSRLSSKKKLHQECLHERYRETETLLATVQTEIAQSGIASVIQSLEPLLRSALFRDAARMLEGLLNDRSLLPDDEPARALECIYPNRPIQVQTLFGALTLRRNYYFHQMAKTGRCPLDHMLDLVRGNTPGVAKLICRASSIAVSYEGAADDLLAYAGLELCGRSFGRFVAEVTPSLLEAQASQPASKGDAIDILYVSEDGTGVPLRRAELVGVKGKHPDGAARTREAKLGCVFTQTLTDEDGQRLRDPDSTTYVGTFEGCRQSGILLRAEAFRRGYARAKKVVYLGDGALWIWENARLNFPDAVLILDFYHGTEHLGALAAALLGAGPAAKAQQALWCSEMKATSSAPIIHQAQNLLEAGRTSMTQEMIGIVEREIAYFKNNLERTQYGEFLAKEYFIGSGVVEAGCKTVVGRRLKQSGMFWNKQGGQDLLGLRCMVLHPDFKEIWEARLPLLAAQRAKVPRWQAAA